MQYHVPPILAFYERALPKNKFVTLTRDELSQFKDELYNLINIAYKDIGGHVKIQKPDDVLNPELSVWRVADIDNDPDIDVVRFGKTTKHGNKSTGVGHDGSKQAKRAYLTDLSNDLKNKGWYIEVSHKLADILIKKYKVPVVQNEQHVRSVVNKPITWHGYHPDGEHEGIYGWYTRKIGGKPITKILVGNPF